MGAGGGVTMKPKVVFDSHRPSGNIFAVLALTQMALRKARRPTDYNECRDRVLASGSYTEALDIIREYVDLIDLQSCNAM